MEVYSHSRLSVFEQCSLKFKYKYIDKIPEFEQKIETHLGKTIHSTLEWLYSKINKKEIPTIDEMIVYYAKKWGEDYNLEKIIIKKHSAVDFFNKGIQFLIDYYIKNKPFDDNTIGIEKEVMFKLDLDGKYKIRGYIDRLVYNEKKGAIEIHDYKTSANLPTKEAIEKDRQLGLYSMAIKELFGNEKEVILTWHYLAHNIKIHSKRTDEQLNQLKNETLKLIKKIEAMTEFPANKGPHCGWCEYKSICPVWKS